MTTIKTLIGTVALLTASTVFAQTGSCELFPKGSDEGQGTIGRRYVQGYLGMQDVRETSTNAYGGGLGANIPFCTGIDLLGNVGYTSFTPHNASTKLTAFDGAVRLYNKVEDDVKPFLQAGLGMNFGDIRSHSTNYQTWSIGFGAEFPYKWVSVTPTITYNDDFRHAGASKQSWKYAAEFSSWATPQVGVFAKVSYDDVRRDGAKAWGLDLGLRMHF